MRTLVTKTNQIFIGLVLFVVYFVGVGLAFIFYKLSVINNPKTKNTYWEGKPNNKFAKEYFLFPY